jgi:hypothetical protein
MEQADSVHRQWLHISSPREQESPRHRIYKPLRKKFRQEQDVPEKTKFKMEGSLIRSSYRHWKKR